MATKSIKKIQELLTTALLQDGPMSQELFALEFDTEGIDFLIESLTHDQDDVLFSITESNGHIALIFIEKPDIVHQNEAGRAKLKEFWKLNYENNCKMLIPSIAEQLANDELPITGMKVAK